MYKHIIPFTLVFSDCPCHTIKKTAPFVYRCAFPQKIIRIKLQIQVPEVVTWTVDTECPDTTFVVLPDVVTHLTSTVLVVKGTDTAADTAAAAAASAAPDAAGSDSTSACTFEYAVDELGDVAGEDGGGGAASGDGSSAASGGGGSSLSASSSSSSQGEGTGAWQQGDSSGVIHLHELKVSCCCGGGGGGGGDCGVRLSVVFSFCVVSFTLYLVMAVLVFSCSVLGTAVSLLRLHVATWLHRKDFNNGFYTRTSNTRWNLARSFPPVLARVFARDNYA